MDFRVAESECVADPMRQYTGEFMCRIRTREWECLVIPDPNQQYMGSFRYRVEIIFIYVHIYIHIYTNPDPETQ